MFAINTRRGKGKKAGARSVKSAADMVGGETFVVDEMPRDDQVLNDDLISFRTEVQSDIDLERLDEAEAAFNQRSINALAKVMINHMTGKKPTVDDIMEEFKGYY